MEALTLPNVQSGKYFAESESGRKQAKKNLKIKENLSLHRQSASKVQLFN